jgi:hypothetical protein
MIWVKEHIRIKHSIKTIEINRLNLLFFSKFMFLGYTHKRIGNHIPNELGNDYLTIIGSLDDGVYTCPNTPEYKEADTDYFWFDLSGNQREITKVDLVAWDLQRTPIAYDNSYPNTVRIIGILNPDAIFTTYERNYLFQFFSLPIFWDNNLNTYGFIKSKEITCSDLDLSFSQNRWSYNLNSETFQYLIRMDIIPDSTRINHLDTLITGLKLNLFWDRLDIIRLCASHNEQACLLNLKGDYWNGFKVGSPIFTIDKGWTGGSGKYINSQFNPRLGNCVMQSGNNFAMVYIETRVPTTASNVMHQGVNNVGGMWHYHNAAGGTFRGNWNTTTSTNYNSSKTAGVGYSWGRKNSTTGTIGIGTNVYNLSVVSPALFVNGNFYDATGYGSRQSLVCYGEYFSDTDLSILRGLFDVYLIAIGVK